VTCDKMKIEETVAVLLFCINPILNYWILSLLVCTIAILFRRAQISLDRLFYTVPVEK
jgi:hypothetical protein